MYLNEMEKRTKTHLESQGVNVESEDGNQIYIQELDFIRSEIKLTLESLVFEEKHGMMCLSQFNEPCNCNEKEANAVRTEVLSKINELTK